MQKNSIKKGIAAIISTAIFPLTAFAEETTIDSLLAKIKITLNLVIGILFVLITIYFIWGVIQYVTSGGDDEKLGKGRKHMLYGIIGLAIVSAAWGLAKILADYIAPGTQTGPTLPTFK